VENIRRAGEVARLMTESGLIVLCSFISPYQSERDMVRNLVSAGEFFEVFVDTPIEECIRRDPKGLYAKAQSGKIKNFTGLDAPYEPPKAPEIRLSTVGHDAGQLADQVLRSLVDREFIAPL
jgi:bifunctional enzyme CysN/CysC